MSARPLQVCLKGMIHFPEESVQAIGAFVPDAQQFVFDVTEELVAFLFCRSFFKTTDREKPGLSFKFIVYYPSGTMSERDEAWYEHYRHLLKTELTKAINKHESINDALKDKDLVTVTFTEVMGFCS